MDRFLKSRFTLLVAALLAMAMLSPFLAERTTRLVFDLLFTLVLLAAIWSVTGRLRAVMSVLAALSLLTTALLYGNDGHVAIGVALVCDILFFIFATGTVLHQVLQDREVSGDTIAGAVAGYFLLGIGWSYIYGMIEMLQPGSFSIGGAQLAGSAHIGPLLRHLLYHSFVTLTTLGYGDLVPVSVLARNLCILEAVAGQFYLAILIARLVAVHTAISYRGGAGKR